MWKQNVSWAEGYIHWDPLPHINSGWLWFLCRFVRCFLPSKWVVGLVDLNFFLPESRCLVEDFFLDLLFLVNGSCLQKRNWGLNWPRLLVFGRSGLMTELLHHNVSLWNFFNTPLQKSKERKGWHSDGAKEIFRQLKWNWGMGQGRWPRARALLWLSYRTTAADHSEQPLTVPILVVYFDQYVGMA